MDTPCESRPIDDRLQSPLHQVLDVEIEDIVNAGRFRKDSESEKTLKVLAFDLGLLFLCRAEERSCYPSYFREHSLMTSKLSLVSETVLTKEMEFRFELFLAPGMTRSLVRLPRLLRVSQYYSFFSSFFPDAAARAASMRTFFLTPMAFPERPVILVRWPLTLRTKECRIPFQLLISFIRSISALFLST